MEVEVPEQGFIRTLPGRKIIGRFDCVEANAIGRVSVVEFPSLERAKACYADPSYQEAKQYALKASRREVLIFEGELA